MDLVFKDEELKEAQKNLKWRQQVDNYTVEWVDQKTALEIVWNSQ